MGLRRDIMYLSMTEVIGIKEICDKFGQEKMPIKTAYKFAKLSKALEKEIEFYQNKFREIVEAYGEKDENGQVIPTEDGRGIKIQQDKLAQAEIEVRDLENLEVEIDDIKFKMEELEGFEMSAQDIKKFMCLLDLDD